MSRFADTPYPPATPAQGANEAFQMFRVSCDRAITKPRRDDQGKPFTEGARNERGLRWASGVARSGPGSATPSAQRAPGAAARGAVGRGSDRQRSGGREGPARSAFNIPLDKGSGGQRPERG
jgi:hypothetical protein